MGRIARVTLTGEVWICACGTHLAYNHVCLSKDFHCNSGTAFLFAEAVNVIPGEDRTERLRSGIFIIADVFCINCNEKLGWTYREAKSDDQKYKERRVVLERVLIHLYGS